MSLQNFNSKKQVVISLLRILENAVAQDNLVEDQHLTLITRLKVLGRNPQDAEPIFTQSGIATLAAIGFDHGPPALSREALRCLANALLLNPQARQTFAALNYSGKVALKLKTTSNDDEFLCSRILFLLTYGASVDFQSLINHQDLAEAINENIIRHMQTWTVQRSKSNPERSTEDDMAFSETLKLLFNMVHQQPTLETHFTPSLIAIVTSLRFHSALPRPPLEPPVNHLINVLLNFDIPEASVFPAADPSGLVRALIEILDTAIVDYTEALLATAIAPLLTLLRRIYEAAPQEVKTYMQDSILPGATERDLPLGRSSSFSSRLLRLSTSLHMQGARDLISGLLFELSGKDANQFVYNIGYGHAAGYLATHNIPLPRTSQSQGITVEGVNAGEDESEAEIDHTVSRGVNLVTGQYLDREPVAKETAMTEDEKLREAERLFVLFERLKNTGVVNVQNPIHAAVEAGYLEEID